MSIAVNNDKILINLEKNMEQLTMREQWCTIFSINQYLLNRFLEQIITVPWQSVILLANISWLFKCDTNETKSTEARGSYLWSTDRNWTLTLICQVSQTRIDPPACLCLAWANEIFLKNLRQLIIISLQIVLYYRFRFYDLFYFNRRLWDWTQKLSSPSFIVMVLMGLLYNVFCIVFSDEWESCCVQFNPKCNLYANSSKLLWIPDLGLMYQELDVRSSSSTPGGSPSTAAAPHPITHHILGNEMHG